MREIKARHHAEAYVERLEDLRRTVDVELERTQETLRILDILEDALARSREFSRRRRRRPAPFAALMMIPSPA